MSSFKPNIARPAIITDVNIANQTCTIQYADRLDVRKYTCPLPHPFAGAGWGIFTGPARGTRVLVDTTVGDRPFIVGTIPMNQFSSDFSSGLSLNNITADQSAYPKIRPGEIALQSQFGTKLYLDNSGAVKLSANDLKIEYLANGVGGANFKSYYTNTEAHREISGVVKRDVRDAPRDVEKTQDKLTSADADRLWSNIGRNPLLESSLLTFNIDQNDKATRNPPLAEHRTLVYEFARTHMVEGNSEEAMRIAGQTDPESARFLSQPNRRDLSRTDVFNLGPHLPNNLIEKIEGTSVDIYGNILDINRNIIDFSDVQVEDERRIEHESALLRRAIKYHFEINSRKHTMNTEGNPDNLDAHNSDDEALQTGYSFSRWSIDIDGEGLTKINIPASSDVGNIPLLTRHLNAHNKEDRNAGDFRPSVDDDSATRRDIQHIPFGNLEGDGVAIPKEYAPPNISSGGEEILYRTAYHDVLTVVEKILDDISAGLPIAAEVDNSIKNPEADAGGRSLHANLDGSLELNIGRDTVDKKSVVLDTAGSIVSTIGKDKNDNSILTQTDGNILVQVGGSSVRGEEVLESNSVRFYVNSADGNSFHKIEITDEGIFITSAPDSNIVISSQNNLILDAKGQTLIGGESVFVHGSHSNNGSSISGERLIERNGAVIK